MFAVSGFSLAPEVVWASFLKRNGLAARPFNCGKHGLTLLRSAWGRGYLA